MKDLSTLSNKILAAKGGNPQADTSPLEREIDQLVYELYGWRFLHYTTKQVKDNWTPFIGQIQKAIDQLGGVEEPENFERKVGEEQGKYIVDGEEPL